MTWPLGQTRTTYKVKYKRSLQNAENCICIVIENMTSFNIPPGRHSVCPALIFTLGTKPYIIQEMYKGEYA